MPVTEALMKQGSFEVSFIEETPVSIRGYFVDGQGTTMLQRNINHSSFGFFGHLFVTPVRLRAGELTLATLLATARYTGIMRRRLRRGIGGTGLLAYLGNDTGDIGAVMIENAPGFPPAAKDFATWVADIVNDDWASSEGDPPYTLGTITNVGATTLTMDPYLMLRRVALDYVCSYFGGEYRVNPDNTFDAGSEDDLFVSDPTKVVVPEGGPQDFDLQALEALALDQEVDFDDMQVYASVVVADGSVETATHGGAQFKDLNGNANVSRLFGIVMDAPNIIGGFPEGPEFAHSVIGPTQDARREVRLSAAGYDFGGEVAAGDSIWVYDPVNLLFDLANPVEYAGGVIWPIKLRARSVTWPIQEGMGVYYRISGGFNEGVILDLSDYVAYEDGGASIEFAERRPLSSRPTLPPGIARAFP